MKEDRRAPLHPGLTAVLAMNTNTNSYSNSLTIVVQFRQLSLLSQLKKNLLEIDFLTYKVIYLYRMLYCLLQRTGISFAVSLCS